MATASDRPNLTQQVTRAVAWNALLGPLKLLADVVSTLVKLNLLSQAQVGLLRLISSAASTAGTWADLGIDRSLPRFIPEVDQTGGKPAVSRLLRHVFAVKGVLLALFLGVLATYGAQASSLLGSSGERTAAGLGDELLWLALATVAVIVVLGNVYDGLMAYLISFFHQRAWNLIGLVSGLVLPLVTAGMILLDYDVPGVLAAMVLAQVVGVGLAGWQVARAMRATSSLPAAGEHAAQPPHLWRRFFFYTAMANLLNISDWLVRPDLAVFVLAFQQQSLAQVAGLSVCFSLVGQVLAYLYTPLVGLQVPLFTRVRGDGPALRAAYAGLGRILLLLLVPGGVGLALLARPAVLIQYPLYVDVVPAAQLLIPLLFVESLLSLGHNVLIVHERYAAVTVSRLSAAVALPLLLWAVPQYGVIGAVAALGAGRLLSGGLATYFAWRAFPLGFSWGFAGRVALATGAMAAVVALLQGLIIPPLGVDPSAAARIAAALPALATALAGVVAFGVALRLLGGILPEDRARLASSKLPLKRWILKLV
jgi:O-antigen/teichoic acid export membrane protein